MIATVSVAFHCYHFRDTQGAIVRLNRLAIHAFSRFCFGNRSIKVGEKASRCILKTLAILCS